MLFTMTTSRIVLLVFTLFLCCGVNGEDEVHSNDHVNVKLTDPHHGDEVSSEPESHGSHSGNDSHSGGGHHGYQVFHVEFSRVSIPFTIMLWIFISSIAKIAFHMTPKLPHIFPESCLLIVVGLLIGALLYETNKHEPPAIFTPDVFFLFMLPPIILDAGYFMPNRLFFDHLGTILLMAVVGTVFNVLTIGASLYGCGYAGLFGPEAPNILEMMLFSSLISAVDPVAVLAVFEEIHVNEILYIVVFGESLLNDAVTVVLYHMFDAYVEIGEENIQIDDYLKGLASFIVVAGGGTVVGIIWGYAIGFITRFTNHAVTLEPVFVFCMAYMSYLNAEVFHLSGIMAITFCGITMKNYVDQNISAKSQTTLRYAMKMLSSSSETIIFMFLGIATIRQEHNWNTAFVLLTILFCTVFRAIGIVIQTALANRYRIHKLSIVDQFVMMYGGLRGAVAFALVLLIDKNKIPSADMFMTTTIAVIYWTVFLQGITIKPLVKFLNVKLQPHKEHDSMNERIAGRFVDHVVSGMEGIFGEFSKLGLRDMYKRLDEKYIKPCILREKKLKDHKIMETFVSLTEKDAIDFVRKNPSKFAGLIGVRTMVDLTLANARDMSKSAVDLALANVSALTNSGSSIVTPSKFENVDLNEMHYTGSQKDLTDSTIHHLLGETLFMPEKQSRRCSYSRHSLGDPEAFQEHLRDMKINKKVRRLMKESRSERKRATRSQKNSRDESEDEPGQRIPGSIKKLQDAEIYDYYRRHEGKGGKTVTYSNVESDAEVDEDCLTFSAKQDGRSIYSESAMRQQVMKGKLPENGHVTQSQSVNVHDKDVLIKFRCPTFIIEETEEEEAKHETPTSVTFPWRRHSMGYVPKASDGFKELIATQSVRNLPTVNEEQHDLQASDAQKSASINFPMDDVVLQIHHDHNRHEKKFASDV